MRAAFISVVSAATSVGNSAGRKTESVLLYFPFEGISVADIITLVTFAVGVTAGGLAIWRHFHPEK